MRLSTEFMHKHSHTVCMLHVDWILCITCINILRTFILLLKFSCTSMIGDVSKGLSVPWNAKGQAINYDRDGRWWIWILGEVRFLHPCLIGGWKKNPHKYIYINSGYLWVQNFTPTPIETLRDIVTFPILNASKVSKKIFTNKYVLNS